MRNQMNSGSYGKMTLSYELPILQKASTVYCSVSDHFQYPTKHLNLTFCVANKNFRYFEKEKIITSAPDCLF